MPAIVHAARGESWAPGKLHPNLSWTHYRTLLRVDKPEARSFYEIEALKNNWGARELERQICSLLYERLALSRDKKGLMRLATKGHEVQKPTDIFKDPVVMEFLGLPESPKLVETNLETALINNLQSFLLELGKGFAFVARQERLTLDGDHFYIDLVFYHTILKCYVIIDLKTADEAKKSDSPISLQQVILEPEQLGEKTVTVVSQSQLASKLGLQPEQTTTSTLVPKAADSPVFETPEDRKVAQIAYRVIRKLENQPQKLPSVSHLANKDVQASVVKEVAAQYRPTQLELEGVTSKPDIAAIVAKTTELVIQQTIDIPRIIVVPTGKIQSGFNPFTLKLDTLNYPPVSEELWAKHLRTDQVDVIAMGKGGIEELRLDDSSHQQSNRQARDEFLDKALAAAGVPVFHFQVKRSYSIQDIRGAIFAQPAAEQKA